MCSWRILPGGAASAAVLATGNLPGNNSISNDLGQGNSSQRS